jgi:hypothetical protein
MRALALLLLLPTLFVQGATFPPPVGPEQAVSEPVLHAAAGDQRAPALASNGEIALVAWNDQRDRFAERVYATRVDAVGNALDPAGLLLSTTAYAKVGGVVWNGTHFAVAVLDVNVWNLVFVAPDGTIAGRRVLDVIGEWADATEGGAGVRMLFVTSGDQPTAAVVDGQGNVIARNIRLVGGGDRGEKIVAGSRGSEFLLLMRARLFPDPAFRTVSILIDGEEGRVVSSKDSGIRSGLQVHGRSAIEGGAAGWVLVAEDESRLRLMVQKLDATGVVSGAPAVLFDPPADGSTTGLWPRIAHENGRFTVAWSLQEIGGPAYTHVAFVTDDGVAAPSRRLDEWPGFAGHVAVGGAGSVRLLITSAHTATGFDLFAQRVTDRLTVTAPVSIAGSLLAQTGVSAAAGRNGYLTGWVESGPDAAVHLLVRRVLPDGTLQGPVLEAGRGEANDRLDDVAVVSNGSHYLVAWRNGTTLYGRRMLAETGLWIDASPFVIADDGWHLAVASNGRDVVAAWLADCGPSGCIQSRRIRLTGDPVTEPVVTALQPARAFDLAMASNGTDYLVTWADGIDWCECPEPEPTEILALRLASDATKLDAVPLVLVGKDAKLFPANPVVAWNAGRYLVAWPTALPDVQVEGAIITAEGAILARRVPLAVGPGQVGSPTLLAHRDQFVLFTLEDTTAPPSYERDTRWTAVVFDAHGPLDTVAALPRIEIAADAAVTLGAASSGSAMLVAYDRIAREAGGVSRAYTRLFGPGTSRRRAVR